MWCGWLSCWGPFYPLLIVNKGGDRNQHYGVSPQSRFEGVFDDFERCKIWRWFIFFGTKSVNLLELRRGARLSYLHHFRLKTHWTYFFFDTFSATTNTTYYTKKLSDPSCSTSLPGDDTSVCKDSVDPRLSFAVIVLLFFLAAIHCGSAYIWS